MTYSYKIQTKGKEISIYLLKDGRRKIESHTRESSMDDARREFNKTLKKMNINYAI